MSVQGPFKQALEDYCRVRPGVLIGLHLIVSVSNALYLRLTTISLWYEAVKDEFIKVTDKHNCNKCYLQISRRDKNQACKNRNRGVKIMLWQIKLLL